MNRNVALPTRILAEITFPNKGKHLSGSNHTSAFVHELNYLGYNGYAKQIGLHITSEYNGSILLEPVNSKDMIGRCQLMLPQDPETLRKIASALVKIADTVQHEMDVRDIATGKKKLVHCTQCPVPIPANCPHV